MPGTNQEILALQKEIGIEELMVVVFLDLIVVI
jgi:hypothetical protein